VTGFEIGAVTAVRARIDLKVAAAWSFTGRYF